MTLEEVEASRRRFVSGMAREVKGYQVDGCFAAGGCPNRIGDGSRLLERIEAVLQEADLLSFLKTTVNGPLKFHHEFRVSLAECPNNCSQVQIKEKSRGGRRFAEVLDDRSFEDLARRFAPDFSG